MKHKLFHCCRLLLLCCFVGVNSWLQFQAIEHVHPHAPHHTTAHASPLCSLFCSIGQMAQLIETPPTPVLQQTASIEPAEPTILLRVQTTPPVSRGPPYSKPFMINL